METHFSPQVTGDNWGNWREGVKEDQGGSNPPLEPSRDQQLFARNVHYSFLITRGFIGLQVCIRGPSEELTI